VCCQRLGSRVMFQPKPSSTAANHFRSFRKVDSRRINLNNVEHAMACVAFELAVNQSQWLKVDGGQGTFISSCFGIGRICLEPDDIPARDSNQ
jgi:hypothetical protein